MSQEVEDTTILDNWGGRGAFKQVSSAFSKNILYRKSALKCTERSAVYIDAARTRALASSAPPNAAAGRVAWAALSAAPCILS